MKLVIEIPEEIIITCMQHIMPVDCEMFARKIIEDIANGKILPEGHGRLIDADELYDMFIDGSEGYDCQTWNRMEIGDIIEDALTIIEADKEV